MVMSMDAAGDAQTVGASNSPMDESAPASRHHQESADEEDEESRASSQTIVAGKQKKQQRRPILDCSNQSTQQQSSSMVQSSVKPTPGDQQLLKKMSVDEEDDDCLSMKKLQVARPKPSTAELDDIGQDSLVARMRDIVEGGQQNIIQQQQHQHQHQHQIPKEPDNGSSGGESLNNQTETNSKASVDSGQQPKRTRHAKAHQHCARHGHHHHHHHHQHNHHQHHQHHQHHHQHQHRRQSVGTLSSKQPNQQQVHNRHNHNHHHHHHHHQAHGSHHHQSMGAVSGQESRRSSQQMSASKQDVIPDSSARLAELKSSTSSVSFSQQAGGRLGKEDQTEPSLADAQVERCEHEHDHDHDHHHHHHDRDRDREHPHHHHGHHHHHAHGRHQHHRSHKKRLVQDAGDEQASADQLDQSVDSMLVAAGCSGRRDASSSNDSRPELESVGKQVSSSKDSSREPLKDVTGGHSNSCPYHEHHQHHHHSRANEQARSRDHTPGRHHHHHHHHNHQNHNHNQQQQQQQQQQEPSSQATDGAKADQDSAQSEQHYHHHHRHHHNHGHHHHHGHHGDHGHGHHHHHHHAAKQRHRTKHKSSSNMNIDDQQQQQQSAEKAASTIRPGGGGDDDRDDCPTGKQPPESADSAHGLPAAAATVASAPSRVQTTEMKAQIMKGLADAESDNKMLLDQEEPNDATTPIKASPANNNSNNTDAVIRMDMSPANEASANRMLPISSEPPFAGALDQSSSLLLKRENKAQQDPEMGAQGASGSGNETTKTAHEFTRSQEPDSVKENHSKLVTQASTPRDSGSQNNKDVAKSEQQQQQQQRSSDSSSEQSSRNQRSSQAKQIVESTILPDRSSKLSWCCCCPCSSLSHRSNSVSKSDTKAVVGASNSNANMCPTLPNVPLEEIRMWSDSFDRLMKCPDGRKVFQDFLRCEYSEENILFWIACEELKSEKEAKNIANKARDIYEDYISILSAKEVSLDSRVRDIINNNIKKPTSNIFDEAQLQIYTLMHRDSYPRFINSPMYKKLAQIQASSRKGSS